MNEPGQDGKALKVFSPSANQLAVLSAFQATDYRCSVLAACKEVGLTPQAYYRWFDENPGFPDWWKAETSAFFARQLGRVHGAALASALGDDIPGASDRKLMMERFDADYCPRGRSELTGANGGAIPLTVVMFGQVPEQTADDETPPGDPAAGA